MPPSEAQSSEWNEHVAASDYGDVLQCLQWGELKARMGWAPLHVRVERGGELIATALLLKRRIPRTRRCILYCPRGPVVDYGDGDAVRLTIEAIREAAQEQGAIVVKLDPPVPVERADVAAHLRELGLQPARGASGFGGVQPRAVMTVDLTPDFDVLLASFHSKWRYNIRLAARKGVLVRTGCRPPDMDTFYDLLEVTAQRDGFGIRAREYFHHIRELIIGEGLGELFMAYVDHAPIAGAIAFTLGGQCWYVYGASDNDHRSLMPNHLVQWEIMRWAKQSGCEVYDMRGVSPEVDGKPVDERLAGLNRFKRGFGAQYVEYIGDWDLVLSRTWYGLFQRALPIVRRRMAAAAEHE